MEEEWTTVIRRRPRNVESQKAEDGEDGGLSKSARQRARKKRLAAERAAAGLQSTHDATPVAPVIAVTTKTPQAAPATSETSRSQTQVKTTASKPKSKAASTSKKTAPPATRSAIKPVAVTAKDPSVVKEDAAGMAQLWHEFWAWLLRILSTIFGKKTTLTTTVTSKSATPAPAAASGGKVASTKPSPSIGSTAPSAPAANTAKPAPSAQLTKVAEPAAENKHEKKPHAPAAPVKKEPSSSAATPQETKPAPPPETSQHPSRDKPTPLQRRSQHPLQRQTEKQKAGSSSVRWGLMATWQVHIGSSSRWRGAFSTWHTDRVEGLVICPFTGHVVSASRDCTLRMWDAKSGKQMSRYYTYDSLATLCADWDAKTVATGTKSGHITAWLYETGKKVGIFKGHTEEVTTLCTGEVGGRAMWISGSADATVRIWDARTASSSGHAGMFLGCRRRVNSVACHGHLLWAGDISGSVKVILCS
ncbi:hypothetical protein CYMTET_48761 [Cymbomonas tetramitiformis]|uniref:Guanine nucleotide-binding protein subunit beta-like protein n=1 Tax=Cymbomonas tetramitiformis TaxID=36881 RepID=A0AAE0BRJ3_9CHLO|nr:hypothetical protein CYMTET_48761 [Cymbomonas tetramitiformis]